MGGDNPDILSDEYFVESMTVDTEDDPNITLTSPSQWTTDQSPGTTFNYVRTGNLFELHSSLGINFYATGTTSAFDLHLVTGVSDEGNSTLRTSYNPSRDPIEALTTGVFSLDPHEGAILAYQTLDVRYTED